MTHKVNSIFALGILLFISMACSFSTSTANLSDLKFGKDKDASGAGTTFKPDDEIFAVTAVNNAGGKHKAKFRLLFDKVEGEQSGAVAYKVETELPVEGSRPIWFNFSIPSGFIPGTFKVETVLTDEDGKELDRKTGGFTIADGSSSNTADMTKPEADKDSEDN